MQRRKSKLLKPTSGKASENQLRAEKGVLRVSPLIRIHFKPNPGGKAKTIAFARTRQMELSSAFVAYRRKESSFMV